MLSAIVRNWGSKSFIGAEASTRNETERRPSDESPLEMPVLWVYFYSLVCFHYLTLPNRNSGNH